MYCDSDTLLCHQALFFFPFKWDWLSESHLLSKTLQSVKYKYTFKWRLPLDAVNASCIIMMTCVFWICVQHIKCLYHILVIFKMEHTNIQKQETIYLYGVSRMTYICAVRFLLLVCQFRWGLIIQTAEDSSYFCVCVCSSLTSVPSICKNVNVFLLCCPCTRCCVTVHIHEGVFLELIFP